MSAMRIPLFVRVARDTYAMRGQWRIEGSKRFNPSPLKDTAGNDLYTVHLKLNLQIPSELLRPSPPNEVDVEIRPEDVGWTTVVEVEVPPDPSA